MTSTDRGTLRTQRILPFARDAIFAAFAQGDLLAEWWGPNGFTTSFERFELREGGEWNVVMQGPDGSRHRIAYRFLAIEPPSRIVIRHVSDSGHDFTLTVELLAHEAGAEVTWNQAFDDPAEADRVRAIVEPANEQNLDRLTAVLERQRSPTGGMAT